jgi:Rieske Fe-S protein
MHSHARPDPAAPEAAAGLPIAEPLVDRRGFVTAAGAAAIGALLAACGGGDPASPVPLPAPTPGAPGGSGSLPAGVTREGSVLRVALAQVPALTATNGFLLVTAAPPTVVVRVAADDYRAFTAICTHAGCLVSEFAGGRIICRCHDSRFDTQGRVVNGPAIQPLRSYPVSLDRDAGILQVTTA